MALSISTFLKIVNNYQNWSSFGDYLKLESATDMDDKKLREQTPFEYWWLVGKQNPKLSIWDIVLYKGKGVFIRPEDSLLPLFTSSLYADMASNYYSTKYNIQLTPCQIDCPTCFLTGTGALLGKSIINGGLLNDQWVIHFLTCEEFEYSAPGHFHICDPGKSDYELIGCVEKGNTPLWIQKMNNVPDNRQGDRCNQIPWHVSNFN